MTVILNPGFPENDEKCDKLDFIRFRDVFLVGVKIIRQLRASDDLWHFTFLQARNTKPCVCVFFTVIMYNGRISACLCPPRILALYRFPGITVFQPQGESLPVTG